MNDYIILLVIIFFISICELVGQSCLKYFHINNDKPRYYFIATLFYAIVCYLLFLSYRYKGMGIINVLWSGISILVILSASMLFFGEKITVLDKIGVVFILIGIFCVLYEGSHEIENFRIIKLK